MKEIIKEYEVDLKRGKIYCENQEVKKCEEPNNKIISSFIDDSILDEKSLKRILNAWTYIFGLPKSIITNKENPWYSQKNIKYSIEEIPYNKIIDKSDAILLITNEESNESLEVIKQSQFGKEIYFIDFKKLVLDDNFLLSDIIYINDKKDPSGQSKQYLHQSNSQYWLPKDYFIKV